MSTFRVLIISRGQAYQNLLERYNVDRRVDPYVIMHYEDGIEKIRELAHLAKAFSNKDIDFSAFPDSWVYTIWREMSDEDAIFDEDGNELTDINPEGKWAEYDDSLELVILKDGSKAKNATFKDIDIAATLGDIKERTDYLKCIWDYALGTKELPSYIPPNHIVKQIIAKICGGAYSSFDDMCKKSMESTIDAVIGPDGEWHGDDSYTISDIEDLIKKITQSDDMITVVECED